MIFRSNSFENARATFSITTDDQNMRFFILHVSSSIRSREILERNGITQDKSVESNRTIC